jgi:hypothetical protein
VDNYVGKPGLLLENPAATACQALRFTSANSYSVPQDIDLYKFVAGVEANKGCCAIG